MCVDPVSAAVAVGTWAASNAPVIALAGTAMTAGTVAYQAYSANQRAQYDAKVAETNAVYADREARRAQERGEDNLREHYRRVAALKGEQRLVAAASGLDTSFGTPAEIAAQTTILANEDAQRLSQNTQDEVQGFLIGGQNYRAEASASRMAGRQALIGGALEVGATALTGASRVGEAARKYGLSSSSGGVSTKSRTTGGGRSKSNTR